MGLYRIVKDPEGLTPSQRLAVLRGEYLRLKIEECKGMLVPREQVITDMQRCADMIRSDLFSLTTRLRGLLSGKILEPHEVQTIVEAALLEIVEGWVASAGIPASAIPGRSR